MMMKKSCGIFWMTGLATFAGSQDEGGLKSSDVKVEFPVVQIGLMDKKGESLPVPKLIFGAMLSVPSPLNFESGDKVQEQVLTAEDSTGKKLGVVTFNLGFLGDPSRESVNKVVVYGACLRLPAADAAWVRLRGTLRVPVARERETPLYEFPLEEKEVKKDVPLSPYAEREQKGDIIVAEEEPACEWTVSLAERKGEEFAVRVSLGSEHRFMIDEWQLFDGKGRKIDSSVLSFFGSVSENFQEDGYVLQFPYQGELPVLKVKLLYKQHVDIVTVPVDVRIGLGGQRK